MKFKPLKDLIASGVDAKTGLDLLEKMLKNLVHVNSYGLDAKNLPYSHNNLNSNNILVAENPETKEKVVKFINFASSVPCANVV